MNPLHGFIKVALRNSYLVLVVALLVVVIGVVALSRIPSDLLPVFDTPAVQIVTFYPGMPAEVMERDIMSRLERWTGQSVGIEHQEAKAMLGVCIVKDFFREGISLDTAMSQVTSYAMSDMFYLPPGTIPPMVMPFDPTAMTPLCLVSVSSNDPSMTEKELYDIAYYQLRNRLQSIQGVIAPAVYGGKLRRILAYVDRDKLHSRGLDPLDVVEAIGKWNTLIPTGNAKLGDLDFQLSANGMVKEVEELDDVPIKFEDGRPIYLRDVGNVEDSSQIQTNVVRINGRRQVYIPIYRQPGENSLAIVQSIKELLIPIKGRLDDKVKDKVELKVVFDQSKVIRNAIEELSIAALVGAFFAALVIVVFLRSFLPSVAVLLTVPLAVLGTFIGLSFSSQTINVMTLGGIALAVGVMVDQAVVIMENILRHLRSGKTPMNAAWDGAREVATPVLVSTLTFIAVFFPIVFLTGMAKFLFAPLAVTVIFAMLFSYFLAMLIIPAFSAAFLSPEGGEKEASVVAPVPVAQQAADEPEDKFSDESVAENPPAAVEKTSVSRGEEMQKWYEGIVRKYTRKPWHTAGAALALFLVTLVAFGFLGRELFPRLDQGQFTLFVRAPSGTRIETTEKILANIEKVIGEELNEKGGPVAHAVSGGAGLDFEDHPNVQMVISNIGVLMDWPAAYTWNSGPMDAFVLVQLKDGRTLGSGECVEKLREILPRKFPGIEFSFDTAGMLTTALNFGLPSPINVRVEGTKGYDKAHQIARKLRAHLAKVEGAVDVRIQQKIDYPQIAIDIDREKAAFYGLTQEEIVRNIVTATNSSINFNPAFWIDENNGNHYFIGVQYREEAIDGLETLQDLPINSEQRKEPVSLKDIATFRQTTAPAEITHLNITRQVDIFINVKEGYDLGTVATGVNEVIAGVKNGEWIAGVDDDDKAARKGIEAAEKTLESIQARFEAGDAIQLEVLEATRAVAAARAALFKYPNLAGKENYDSTFEIIQAGEYGTFEESLDSFSFGFALAGILIYLILVVLFRSLREPLVILLSVPLGLIGVGWMLLATGTTLNIQSFMGILLMAGLVVEYGILLVDFANRRRREGAGIEEAIIEAAVVRLRPILMTSLTTVLALIPMAFFGGGTNAALSRTILGGVAAATVLTLLVMPALYCLLAKRELSKEVELEM